MTNRLNGNYFFDNVAQSLLSNNIELALSTYGENQGLSDDEKLQTTDHGLLAISNVKEVVGMTPKLVDKHVNNKNENS